MMMVDTSFIHMIYDTIVSSPFDLLLFAFGVIGYIVLSRASRGFKESKQAGREIHITTPDAPAVTNIKQTDSEGAVTLDVPEVINTNQWAGDAFTHLSQVLKYMETCNTDELVAAEINAFFDKYQTHAFTMADVQTILAFCRSTFTEKAVADKLFECMKSTEEWDILSAFIQFYLDDGQSEKACDVFELNYATFFDIELDENMEWRLLMAALTSERQSLAEHLLATSQSDIETHVLTIQQRWRQTSARISEARAANMGDVLNRLSNMFNDRFPFEEHSDGESTCFLGDDSDRDSDSDDGEWDKEQL